MNLLKWQTGVVIALSSILAMLFAIGAAAEEFSRYDIVVTLDPQTHTLAGTQIVDYVNDGEEALEAITFVLVANQGRDPNPYLHPALEDAQYIDGFDPTWTKILSVTNGAGDPMDYQLEAIPPALTTYSLDDGLLRVRLAEPLDPGGRTQVALEFETKFARALWGDNNVNRDVYIWRFGWNPMACPNGHAEQEKFELLAAFYDIELSVPRDFVVAAGTERQEIVAENDEWKTLSLTSDVPTRSVPLVIGKDISAFRMSWQDVTIDSYYLPGGESAARLAATYAADILTYHSEHFGPYASKRLVIVENPTAGLYGMGASGMILLGTSNYRLKDVPAQGTLDRFLDYLIAHEIAHLWWGIGVGADFNAENWLSEGFAEYLSYTYFEEKYGGFEPNLFAHLEGGLIEEVVRSQFGYWNLRYQLTELPYLTLLKNGFDEAIVKPRSKIDYLNGLSVRTYNKGYLVLRALDGLLGHDVMLQILQQFYARYNNLIPTVESFRQVAEEVSGRELEGFFNSWLYGADTLDVAVDGLDSSRSDDGYQTVVHLSNEGEAIYPVTVRAITAEGEELDATWRGDAAQGTVSFASSSPVVRVQVDPLEVSPDKNRFNNHFPRRVVLKHPFREEGWKIGQPLDAYLISISPMSISGSFRNDHQWALAVLPQVEQFDELSELDQLRWTATGFFAANLGRELSVDGLATLVDYDPSGGAGFLDAQLGLNVMRFEHPPIGVAGRYWFPANLLRIAVGTLGDLPRPTAYVGFDYARLDILQYYLQNTLSLRLGIPGFGHEPFGTFEWNGLKRFRLAHMLYVDIDLGAGKELFGTPPESFGFSLERLHAFAEDFVNDRGVFGRLILRLPPVVRGLGYSLLSLAHVDSVYASLFVQGGQTWASGDCVGLSDPKLEAGVESTITVTSFLSFPLGLTVGYAYPFLGAESGAGGEFFVNFYSAF